MRKIKLLMAACALMMGATATWAQATYNHVYKAGAEVAAGGDYFLYNIGSGQFLTAGLNYGTRATVDNSGRVITLSENGTGYNIHNTYVSLNNRTDAKAGYVTTNGYVDSGSSDAAWVFTPVSVEGYTNAYTIKNSDSQYLYFDANNEDPGCLVNVGDNTNNNYSSWLLIPKSTRETAGDYSHYLINTQNNSPWEFKTWGNSTVWNDNAVLTPGGKVSNRCAEKYHATSDIYQEIKEKLPNGRYKFYAQGFWRQDGTAAGPVLYANKDTKILLTKTGSENSMDDASNSFTAGNYINSVETFVEDGVLRVGINITATDQWVIFDNFVLDYLGQCVMDYATPLPDGGAMVADTWYYFDIAVVGDNYNATATTLGDIICVTDGYTKTSVAEGSISLKAEGNSFSVQRYYVKSSSSNNLVVAPASYTYTVGSASIDMSYVQKGKTVTVSYEDLVTSNPSASVKIDFSGVTFGGNSISVTPTANGFTFEVPEVTAEGEYTLVIPANAIGYEEGSTYNSTQNFTLKTPAIFDGVYYMYNTDTKTYISRFGDYNTQAKMDEYGMAFRVTTDAHNNTKLQYFDSFLWLGDDGFCYGDCTGGRVRSYNVTKVEGGYKFLNTNNSKYLAVYGGATVGDAEEGVNLQGTSNIWALESTTAHVANYTKNEDAQAVVAATAAGLMGITTKAALEAELSANYGTTPITITGAKAEKFQEYPGNGKDSGPVTYYSETVENLKPGLYKLSVDAFQRAASNDRVAAADGARSIVYLYAGDAKTQLKSIMDYGAPSEYANDFSYKGSHYPNDEASAYTALETGNYTNDVYVYVADAGEGKGSIEIGIKNPTRLGGNFDTWVVYNNWTLTYYGAKATAAEKEALANAITDAEAKTLGFEENEYAPYNNVAALEALAAAKAIEPETASGAGVVAATAALTSAVWTANDAAIAEALYDGTLKLAPIQATAENVALPGWVTKSGNLRQTFNDAEQKPCLAGATDGVGLFVHPGTYVYGETTGYTMPLKANTVYVAEAKYCGWSGDSNKGFSISIGGASKEFGANANDVTKADALKSVKLYFKTQEAGNYLLTVTVSGNTFMTDFSVRQSTDVETVTITSAGYATYVSDVDLDFTGVSGLTAYKATVTGETATFEEVTTVPAGEGVLLKGAANTYNVPVTAGVAAWAAEDNAFVRGTGAAVSSDNGDGTFNYILNKVDDKVSFYLAAGNTVAANRAYLTSTKEAAARLNFFFDETTGISTMKTVQDNKAMYNLNGQRIQNAKKGLYILNGKKVIK